jgi:hypothetical protein
VPLTITADTNAQTITITNHTVAVGDQVHVQWHSIACLCDPNDTVGYFDANNPSIFVTTPIDGMCDGVICFVMNTPGTFMFGFFRGNSTNNITPLQVVTVGSPPVDSVLRLLIQRAGAGFVKISWFGQMGMRYDVLSSTNVSAPLASWPRITTISVTNSGVVNFTYPVTNTASLFFSVRKH